MSRLSTKRPDEILVEAFFEAKGYPSWPDSFYQKNKIKFGRFLKPANELLALADNDLEKAKIILDKTKEMADKNGWEDWNLATTIKYYLELTSAN